MSNIWIVQHFLYGNILQFKLHRILHMHDTAFRRGLFSSYM